MRGSHARLPGPLPGELYVAAVDLAGQDEAGGGTAALHNPGRDYTVATVFRVIEQPDAPGPAYEAVDVFVDHGSRHFQAGPGQPRLADTLLNWLRRWDAAHVIVDASGVGQGLADWLSSQLGPTHVTTFHFGGAAKARLGSDFLGLIDTGRFRYWAGEELPGEDGWWFWQQATACAFALPGGGRFDHDLRWGVADRARVSIAGQLQHVHDDRLLSAALIAELDRRRQQGALLLGLSASRILPGANPLASKGF